MKQRVLEKLKQFKKEVFQFGPHSTTLSKTHCSFMSFNQGSAEQSLLFQFPALQTAHRCALTVTRCVISPLNV